MVGRFGRHDVRWEEKKSRRRTVDIRPFHYLRIRLTRHARTFCLYAGHHTLDNLETADVSSQVAGSEHRSPSTKPKPSKYESNYEKALYEECHFAEPSSVSA